MSFNNTNVILGAPGCGKTTKLMSILEDELSKYEPNEIAFVSFTKKGSYEGRDRAMQKFGFKEDDFPYFRTIHSLAFRDLGLSRYDVISSKNYKEFSKSMGMNFVGYYTEDLVNNDDKYLFYESLRKNNKKAAENALQGLDYKTVKMVEGNYGAYKKFAGVKDFDDMIIEFIEKNQSLPVKVAIIDEAQDLTSLQWEFCKVAFKDCDKVYIAGDDDQAIYEWSGADVEFFLSLTKNSKIHILNKSHRLKKDILLFSKKISSRIHNRVDKVFDPVGSGGNIYFHNKISDIPINSEQSYYFLSRNNYFLPKIKSHIMSKGITFWYKNKYSINYNIARSIKRYEEYRKQNNYDAIKTDVILNDMLKKDFTVFKEWYHVFDLELDEINYYRDLFKNKIDPDKCNVMINTIHGVKGGEADNVIVMMDITKNINNAISANMEAELRCLYVAFTRAKTNLHIIYSSGNYGYDNSIINI